MSQDTSAAVTGAPGDGVVVEETTVVAVVGPGLLARLGAEAFGTFFLVLAIVGVALYSIGGLGPGVLGVALAGGIALLAGIAAVGHVSGGHFNPAVTLGAAVAGRTAWRDVLPYWLAQLVGATIAGLVLFATIPQAALTVLQQGGLIAEASKAAFFRGAANGFDTHSPLAAATNNAFAFTLFASLLIEVVVTAIFVGVILGVTDKRANPKLAPVSIGLALAVLILVAAPFTNASLNPARSFAVAIFGGDWALSQLWVFIVAPLVGAAIAALFYRAFAVAPTHDDLLAEEDVVVLDEFSAEQAPAAQAPSAPYVAPAAGAAAAVPTAAAEGFFTKKAPEANTESLTEKAQDVAGDVTENVTGDVPENLTGDDENKA